MLTARCRTVYNRFFRGLSNNNLSDRFSIACRLIDLMRSMRVRKIRRCIYAGNIEHAFVVLFKVVVLLIR
jgi:hypothetical protein